MGKSETTYWRVGHSVDTTETGMFMACDYIQADWVGHPGQYFYEEAILREWCREKHGPEVDFVQGVAACEGWKLSECTKEQFDKADPITWGGRKTATRRIHLQIGRKRHDQPAVAIVSDDDALEPLPVRCDKCGHII